MNPKREIREEAARGWKGWKREGVNEKKGEGVKGTTKKKYNVSSSDVEKALK